MTARYDLASHEASTGLPWQSSASRHILAYAIAKTKHLRPGGVTRPVREYGREEQVMELIMPVVMLLVIGTCIIVPIVLKHRLYHAQLTLITKAIEKGVDPASMRSSLQIQPRSGDINGNWKAGVVLVAFGVGLFFLMLLTTISEGFNPEMLSVLIIAVLGIALLVVHYSVVGSVVRVRPDELTDGGSETPASPLDRGEGPRS